MAAVQAAVRKGPRVRVRVRPGRSPKRAKGAHATSSAGRGRLCDARAVLLGGAGFASPSRYRFSRLHRCRRDQSTARAGLASPGRDPWARFRPGHPPAPSQPPMPCGTPRREESRKGRRGLMQDATAPGNPRRSCPPHLADSGRHRAHGLDCSLGALRGPLEEESLCSSLALAWPCAQHPNA